MELSIIKYPSAGSRGSSGRRRSSTACLSVVLFLALLLPAGIHGHGRLIQPPSRSSAWRFKFPTPANYNDHEIYCGGFARQWSVNGGKCGPCGDPWDQPQPRDNEGGGKYGLGVITATYQEAAEIDIGVELTASHMGFFEFRVCPHNSPKTPVSQACLDKYPLQRSDGSGIRFYPKKPEKYYIRYVLPKDVTCKQCVLQWRYVAGNNWGNCPNGTGMVGCGPQEEFRSCSDITITRSDGTAASTPLPVPPGVHDEDYNEIEDDEIEVDKNVSLDKEANTSYVGHVVALTVAAILVPSIITATIIYFYCSRELVRNTFRRQSRLCRTFEGLVRNRQARIHTPDDAIKKDPGALEAQVPEVPVPPPRRHRSASITPAVSGRMEPSPGIPVPGVIIAPKPWSTDLLEKTHSWAKLKTTNSFANMAQCSTSLLKKYSLFGASKSDDQSQRKDTLVIIDEVDEPQDAMKASTSEEEERSVSSEERTTGTDGLSNTSTDSSNGGPDGAFSGDGGCKESSDDNSTTCDECSEHFSNKYFLQAHLITQHGIYNPDHSRSVTRNPDTL